MALTLWIVNQYIPPPVADARGPARHLHLARHLVRSGYRVVLLSGALSFHDGQSNDYLADGEDHRDFREDGLMLRLFRGRPYRGLLSRLSSMRHFERRVISGVDDLPRPDIVIGSSVHLFAARAGATLADRYQVPFIFEVRDIWPLTIAQSLPAARLTPPYWYLRWMEISLYRQAVRVLSLLPLASRHVARSFADPEKVVYLPNMVDIDPYLQDDYPMPPERSTTFTVLYIGSMIPACALEFLIDAAQIVYREHPQLPIRFRLVGAGVVRERLEQEVKQLGLPNVEFAGPIPRQAVVAEIAAADALFASFRRLQVVARYGMSMNKVFEYLAGARPIILSADSANDPVGSAGAGITVPAQDARAIADAAVQLFRTPYRERVEMGQRGREFARSYCSAHVIGARLEAVIEEVLAGEAPGTRVNQSVIEESATE